MPHAEHMATGAVVRRHDELGPAVPLVVARHDATGRPVPGKARLPQRADDGIAVALAAHGVVLHAHPDARIVVVAAQLAHGRPAGDRVDLREAIGESPCFALGPPAQPPRASLRSTRALSRRTTSSVTRA